MKYTSAQRPMCAAKRGFRSGFSSGSGNMLTFGSSVGCANIVLQERGISMIALPANKVVNSAV